jgi:hypothetical protein
METALETLTAKIFAAQLHTRFKAQLANSAPLELELSEVEEHDASPKIELFFLRFRGPRAPILPQQIHRLEHEKLGTFSIFLTAIGNDEDGIKYESVFHRFRKKPAMST